MSKFFVGQRVRIRFCYRPHKYGDTSGMEGVIWGFNPTGEDGGSWFVEIAGVGKVRPGGSYHQFGPEQLEPILPDGAAPSEFTTLGRPAQQLAGDDMTWDRIYILPRGQERIRRNEEQRRQQQPCPRCNATARAMELVRHQWVAAGIDKGE